MCVRCALDVERSDNCFAWNVSQLEISRFKISLVVDWWMSENWGNVCEFRVECEVNDERMRVECETNEERMLNGWCVDDEWTMNEWGLKGEKCGWNMGEKGKMRKFGWF